MASHAVSHATWLYLARLVIASVVSASIAAAPFGHHAAQSGSHHGQSIGSGHVRGFEYTDRTVILRRSVDVTCRSNSCGASELSNSTVCVEPSWNSSCSSRSPPTRHSHCGVDVLHAAPALPLQYPGPARCV